MLAGLHENTCEIAPLGAIVGHGSTKFSKLPLVTKFCAVENLNAKSKAIR
jgi:hypothetical protein